MKKQKSPIWAALSMWLVLTAFGLIGGILITRFTGSYLGGLIASNLGSLLGIVFAFRVYQSETRGR